MSDLGLPLWYEVRTIVFDFDGVFTDNKVWIGQDGTESVRCDRGDGLAFDLLRRFIKQRNWELDYFILSKEKNPVVSVRATKLHIPCIQGVSNKVDYLSSYIQEQKLDTRRLLYVGNDLNDLGAMQLAGCSVAPSDAHRLIKQQANVVLPHQGGAGFVRAFIEEILRIDQMTVEQVLKLF